MPKRVLVVFVALLFARAAPAGAAPSPIKVDVLFVIDDSGSMREEQDSLARNFDRFIAELRELPGGLPDLHIGVVSSNVGAGWYNLPGCFGDGDDGRLLPWPQVQGCPWPRGAFISDEIAANGERVRNYDATLEETFACIAPLGVDGCGYEQHLEAMRRALGGANPANAGFIRGDAYLAVIFIADEDDCSASDPALFDPSDDALGPLHSFRCAEQGLLCDGQPLAREAGWYGSCEPWLDSPYLAAPDEYADFLRSIKPPHKIFVAAITGQPGPVAVTVDQDGYAALAPACESANGVAAPAVRFQWFLKQFDQNQAFTSICNDDLSEPVSVIGRALRRTIVDAEAAEPEQPSVDDGGCAIAPVSTTSAPWFLAMAVVATLTALGRSHRRR